MRPALIAGLLVFTASYSIVTPSKPFEIGSFMAWALCICTFLIAISYEAIWVGGKIDWAALAFPLRQWLTRPPFWILMAVLAVALLLRLIQLENVPPLFHGDEGEMGVNALAIAQNNSSAPPFFGTGSFFSHPSMHYYMEALSIKVFGVTLFALRFVTAMWGVLGVAATFLVAREIAGTRAGLLAAGIAASAPVDLHLSRLSLNNVETAVLCALAIYCLQRGVRRLTAAGSTETNERFWSTTTALSFGLAGIFAGFSLYFYYGSRILPVVLIVVGLFALLRYPQRRDLLLQGALLSAAGALVVALPLIGFFIRFPAANGNDRTSQYLILQHMDIAEKELHASSPAQVLWIQLQQSLAQFFTRPDASSFFPFQAPILIAPVAALFVGGMILVTVRLLRSGSFTLFAWFWITLIAGNVLFSYAPYTPRIVGLLPAVYVLAGMGLDWFLRQAQHYRLSVRAADLICAFLLTAITATSIHEYFGVYFRTTPNPPPTAVARFVAQLPNDTYVYDLADGLFFGYGPTRYLAYRIKGEDVPDPPTNVPKIVPKSDRLAFIVFPRWQDQLPAIMQRFPGGSEHDFLDFDGKIMFQTYVVSGAGGR